MHKKIVVYMIKLMHTDARESRMSHALSKTLSVRAQVIQGRWHFIAGVS